MQWATLGPGLFRWRRFCNGSTLALRRVFEPRWCMRLIILAFTAALLAGPVSAQEAASSAPEDTTNALDLPVSLDRIKEGLERGPTLSFRTLDERPTFSMQILERQKIDELLSTLDFKSGPSPAGGVYWDEVQRQMWPSVDHPLNQPYAAFSQGELLTILVENLAGKYLGGKALNAVSNAERARAEAAASQEVQQAIHEYCSAQPDSGRGIEICSTSGVR